MTSYELLYKHPYEGKGNDPESPEFIVRIYPDKFEQWKKGTFNFNKMRLSKFNINF